MKKFIVILKSALVALLLPFPLSLVLNPWDSIIAVIVMGTLGAIIDYAIAGSMLKKGCPEWFGRIWPHFITGTLTLLWCLFWWGLLGIIGRD